MPDNLKTAMMGLWAKLDAFTREELELANTATFSNAKSDNPRVAEINAIYTEIYKLHTQQLKIDEFICAMEFEKLPVNLDYRVDNNAANR